jgi:nucleotide-binding universal stress UspA family protein
VHVGERPSSGSKPPKARHPRIRRKTENALLSDISALAGRYGFERIETVVHQGGAPDDAIIEEAERNECDLIVIGVSRRVGETLFLGQTVATLLREWRGAMVIVAV